MLAVCGACGDKSVGPFTPEFVNNTDDFSFQVTKARGLSSTYFFQWQITVAQAGVSQTSSISAGSGSITLQDDNGAVVYTSDLAQSGDFVTNGGPAGNWTIRITFTNMTGTVAVRLLKYVPPPPSLNPNPTIELPRGTTDLVNPPLKLARK